jgi:hypothetical protein
MLISQKLEIARRFNTVPFSTCWKTMLDAFGWLPMRAYTCYWTANVASFNVSVRLRDYPMK